MTLTLGFRARMIAVMAVFALAPLGLVVGLTYTRGSGDVRRSTARQMQNLADLKARAIRRRMTRIGAHLRRLQHEFRDRQNANGSSAGASTWRRWLMDQDLTDLEVSVAILDLGGTVVVATRPDWVGADWRGLPGLEVGRLRVTLLGPHSHAHDATDAAAYGPLRGPNGATVAELAIVGAHHALVSLLHAGIPSHAWVDVLGPNAKPIPVETVTNEPEGGPIGWRGSAADEIADDAPDVAAGGHRGHGASISRRARLGWRWAAIVVGMPETYALADVRSLTNAGAVAMLLVACASLVIALLVGSNLSTPVLDLSSAARRMANGDLSPLPPTTRRDELGTLWRELDRTRGALAGARQELRGRLAVSTASLHDREQLIGALFDSLPDVVLVVDGAYMVKAANRRAMSLFGEDIEGRPCFAALYRRDTPCDGCPLQRARDGDVIRNSAAGRANTSGEAIDFDLVPVGPRGAHSDAALYVGRVVTDERALQQRLVHHERMAAIGLLAAGIAHEVGNPLASLSSLIQRRRRRATADADLRDLRLCLEQLDRIDRAVKGLARVARPSRGSTHRTSLQDVAARAIKLIAYDPRARGVTLELLTATNVPTLQLDEDAWFHAVLNLLINALDAMAESDTREVTVEVTCDGQYVSLAVRDSGVGMTAQVLEHALDPGFTTKSVGHGTGLGLHTVAAVAQAVGGDVHIESTSSEGATVTMRVPVGAGATGVSGRNILESA